MIMDEAALRAMEDQINRPVKYTSDRELPMQGAEPGLQRFFSGMISSIRPNSFFFVLKYCPSE